MFFEAVSAEIQPRAKLYVDLVGGSVAAQPEVNRVTSTRDTNEIRLSHGIFTIPIRD